MFSNILSYCFYVCVLHKMGVTSDESFAYLQLQISTETRPPASRETKH